MFACELVKCICVRLHSYFLPFLEILEKWNKLCFAVGSNPQKILAFKGFAHVLYMHTLDLFM